MKRRSRSVKEERTGAGGMRFGQHIYIVQLWPAWEGKISKKVTHKQTLHLYKFIIIILGGLWKQTAGQWDWFAQGDGLVDWHQAKIIS